MLELTTCCCNCPMNEYCDYCDEEGQYLEPESDDDGYDDYEEENFDIDWAYYSSSF